jgi:hypothetical protein
LNLLIKNGADRRTSKHSSLLRKIRNVWNRRNKVTPEPLAQDVEVDAPKQFVEEFVSKRDFIAENIDEDQRLTIITLLLFNRIVDFGEDSACQRYLGKLYDDGAACRAAMRSILNASKELSRRSAADDASSGFFVSFWRRLQSLLLSSVFGQDTVKSIDSFHHLNISQQNELMIVHNFPEVDSIRFSTATADEIVAQCLVQGKAATEDVAQYAADFKSLALEERDLGSSAPLFRELSAAESTPQPIRSGTAVGGDLRQSSVSQNSQVDSRQLRDLETQLSELKELLRSSRAENLELKQALAAANPEQKS